MFVARDAGGRIGECPRKRRSQASYTCPACGGGLRYKDRAFKVHLPMDL